MQAKNKTLEPFDYSLDKELMLPSIFVESFEVPIIAPDDKGINQIINQFEDISMNYYNYIKEKKKLKYDTTTKRYYDAEKYPGGDLATYTNEDPYEDDILDNTGFMRYRPKLVDAQKEDGQTMLIQQNSMYIVGMITTATLLITAIMLAR
jgi:hypothetical protein